MITVPEALKLVIQTLNIKDVSQTTIDRIDIELQAVPSLENYIAYFEVNMNHADADKKTGYQKFLVLNKKYKDKLHQLLAREELGTATGRAKELATKVKQVTKDFDETEYKILDLGKGIKSLHFRSFKGFFTDTDISTLSIIGDLKRCIAIQKSVSGEDALLNKIEALLKGMALKRVSGQNTIANKNANQQRIANMTKQVMRA